MASAVHVHSGGSAGHLVPVALCGGRPGQEEREVGLRVLPWRCCYKLEIWGATWSGHVQHPGQGGRGGAGRGRGARAHHDNNS